MRPVLLLPEDLLPEDLLPEDLLPEDLLPDDLVELLFVVVLLLDPDELLLFLTPLFFVELLLVLLFVELLSLFPESFVERADVPERVVDFFLAEDFVRLPLVSLCFAFLSSSRARTRLSSSEPMSFRLVPRWFAVPVEPRSKLLLLLSVLIVASLEEPRSFVLVDLVELWFAVLALRVAP